MSPVPFILLILAPEILYNTRQNEKDKSICGSDGSDSFAFPKLR